MIDHGIVVPRRRYDINSMSIAVKQIKTIWEAGHYYKDFGPTKWSTTGWNILRDLIHQDDYSMLFIDDVHPRQDVHDLEQCEEIVEFLPQPYPDFFLSESAMQDAAFTALKHLSSLSRRKRARLTWRPRRWSCSGFPLTTPDGYPLCLLFDLGLTWHKYHLGFRKVINILPFFYESEQRGLIRIARKVMPDLNMEVILYHLNGQWHFLDI